MRFTAFAILFLLFNNVQSAIPTFELFGRHTEADTSITGVPLNVSLGELEIIFFVTHSDNNEMTIFDIKNENGYGDISGSFSLVLKSGGLTGMPWPAQSYSIPQKRAVLVSYQMIAGMHSVYIITEGTESVLYQWGESCWIAKSVDILPSDGNAGIRNSITDLKIYKKLISKAERQAMLGVTRVSKVDITPVIDNSKQTSYYSIAGRRCSATDQNKAFSVLIDVKAKVPTTTRCRRR